VPRGIDVLPDKTQYYFDLMLYETPRLPTPRSERLLKGTGARRVSVRSERSTDAASSLHTSGNSHRDESGAAADAPGASEELDDDAGRLDAVQQIRHNVLSAFAEERFRRKLTGPQAREAARRRHIAAGKRATAWPDADARIRVRGGPLPPAAMEASLVAALQLAMRTSTNSGRDDGGGQQEDGERDALAGGQVDASRREYVQAIVRAGLPDGDEEDAPLPGSPRHLRPTADTGPGLTRLRLAGATTLRLPLAMQPGTSPHAGAGTAAVTARAGPSPRMRDSVLPPPPDARGGRHAGGSYDSAAPRSFLRPSPRPWHN
jgi:hypothetical protein